MAFPTFPPLRLRLAEYYLYAEYGGRPVRETYIGDLSQAAESEFRCLPSIGLYWKRIMSFHCWCRMRVSV